MELVFQENKLEFWNCALCCTAVQEQTTELIVPDRLPDAQRVVDAAGTVLVRAEECSASNAGVSGSVAVSVVYVDEAGNPYRLQGQVPFSLRRELADDASERVLQACCTLASVDARLLNSRKLLVRVNVCCEFRVFSRREELICDLPAPSENLQLLRREFPMQMPLAMGEKSFTLNEELILPAGKAPIGELLKSVCHARVLEQKCVGARLVFKGEIVVHTLYSDADGQLQGCDFTVPFSQFADLGSECDEAQAHTQFALTSLELEPDGQLECRRLLLSVGVLAQCRAQGERRVTLLEDAYCLDAELTPRFSQWSMCATLDEPSFRETAIFAGDFGAQRIIDACVYVEEPQCRREGERLVAELPLNCNVVYLDLQGALCAATLRSAVVPEIALSENGACRVARLSAGEIYSTVSAEETELRCAVSVTLECFADQTLRALSGGEISEEPLPTRRPAVLLRRTDGQEELWQIAKSCRSSVAAIRAANELTGELAPADTMLLIPM